MKGGKKSKEVIYQRQLAIIVGWVILEALDE
jgi:hypothetical protein